MSSVMRLFIGLAALWGRRCGASFFDHWLEHEARPLSLHEDSAFVRRWSSMRPAEEESVSSRRRLGSTEVSASDELIAAATVDGSDVVIANDISMEAEILVEYVSVSISSETGAVYALVGDGSFRLMHVHYSNMTLSRVLLKGGSSDLGGAIRLDDLSNATISEVIITGNDSGETEFSLGAGIAATDGSNVIIVDSVISSNRAHRGGGAGVYVGTEENGYGTVLTLVDTVVKNNSAGFDGGGLYIRGAQNVATCLCQFCVRLRRRRVFVYQRVLYGE
ncbi:hypothetical protein CTAYLR_000234 [Chrysophaeum taylorii]|uniref:Right handed beta helix domain-containing protein n=1 Tax=Chrysophaeum taylorii TaxID=2483200 RepID=A0AAD7XJ12_9STRA|nr:hypothetical protein CTAYLR_000234 [Chrysophaeum taylorii]